jgi:polyribonucleotide nucleotidyltransferase
LGLTKKSIKFGNQTLSIETGVIARQATAAVMVDLDGTSVLVTLVCDKSKVQANDFFPLRVDYQEKFYASGKIPGGFFKREGRASERETLIARLIDRPMRPLFPREFTNEVQIVAMVVSINPQVESDIPAMIGASAVAALSGLPISETFAAARVGYADGCYILNPTSQEMETSKLDLVVAGTKSSVLMVESEADVLSESVMLGAVMFGHSKFQPVIQLIEELKAEAGDECWDWQAPEGNKEVAAKVEHFAADFATVYTTADKIERQNKRAELCARILESFNEQLAENTVTDKEVNAAIEDLERRVVRNKLLRGERRIDGRDAATVRPITIQTGLLPRTHGSALFTRGETQALAVVTLGSTKDAQIIDGAYGEQKDNFMLHYNFPPYSVGEIGMIGSPKRREVGHGKLAKRGLQAIIPGIDQFKYVLRLVSEITESNGSSSMATICGGSLALMDAGVPIKAPVAGIAMGLIKEGDKFAVLTDILGDEDHLGDMDFKVAGTSEGITALQMDIKISGITKDIMSEALENARTGRLHILKIMNQEIDKPRPDISEFAPRITTFRIPNDKIKDVIGKQGAVIKGIIEETGAVIEINDDGVVQIISDDKDAALQTKARIEEIIAVPEIGKVYEGKVVRIEKYGAFVNFMQGQDGLVHISQIVDQRVENVTDFIQLEQAVYVKVLEIDEKGKVKLSMRGIQQDDSSLVVIIEP